jgi:hypothetical protein
MICYKSYHDFAFLVTKIIKESIVERKPVSIKNLNQLSHSFNEFTTGSGQNKITI